MQLATPPTPPRRFQLGEFHFAVLGPDCADEDFAAVTSSAAELDGLFGSAWPRGLTWDKNRSDLERHAREFDQDFAFAWVIRDPVGTYLGCAYLRPTDTTRSKGQAYVWLQTSQTNPKRLSDLADQMRGWMTGLGYTATQYPLVTP